LVGELRGISAESPSVFELSTLGSIVDLKITGFESHDLSLA